MKKTDASASQGLLHGQEHAILRRTFRRAGDHHVPQASERTNRVFGIVVVPRHVIIVQKCEQPIPVLIDPLLQRRAGLGRALHGGHVIQKPFGRPLVFPEMSFLQAVFKSPTTLTRLAAGAKTAKATPDTPSSTIGWAPNFS
jgi:hypothetical protein